MAKKKKDDGHFFIKFFGLLFIIIVCSILFGYYVEPTMVKINSHNVYSEKFTDNFDGFTIVHLSDIHFGNNFDISDLNSLVRKVNDAKPDIVVITGDLLSKNMKMSPDVASKISKSLKKISTECGKYIISGDEDTKFDEWVNIVNEGDFINLSNDYDTIYKNGYDSMLIAGVSSFSDKESIINKNQKTLNFYNSFEKDGPIYNILLMHEADYFDELEKNYYDLVLSGHSMGGIVNIPLYGPAVKNSGSKKYSYGHYSVNKAELYVSNGIGVGDINFRLFNTPSIDVYRLIKK